MDTSTLQNSEFRLTFLGATGTVTGSRYLVEAGGKRLLVDCGLFQGYKALRLRNWEEFPVDPSSIDAVLLTHAHLDHSGYLPRLVDEGFKGVIWCTPATRRLCGILLPDSAHLLGEEAEYANRKGSTKHHPARPLYDENSARGALRQMRHWDFDQSFEPVPGVIANFRSQGHILGAAAITLAYHGVSLTFSGDIGRPNDPVMRPPSPPAASDWIVTESTYGDREHSAGGIKQELCAALEPVLRRGGVAIIPAFAVGRAQSLLHVIAQLQLEGALPAAPVYLNSPMATDVTSLYRQYTAQLILDDAALERMHRNTRIVNSAEDSKQLNQRKGPMIIVSASGMVTGGRVLHHLVAFASDPLNAIILCGFQAGGTRGALLAEGARRLRIYGQDVEVKAEVKQLSSASAHADAPEILAWLKSAPNRPRAVFVTHGEPSAADRLRVRIERELGWDAIVPEFGASVDLMSTTAQMVPAKLVVSA
ncbi:MBL fold metallo-hydrolase RNA specificity domain-containing protein [Lysobacter capsici]|uniref:MBL fold metallo-hydrolase RNA specificity domain-containing protein n=1 Tax=Lysobacter capsici TaxID=435897 RepID=UPI0007164227|nr:MBL fold metallo-hydrolase [Lysobacter capsici]